MGARPRLLIIGPRNVSGLEGGIEKFTEEFIRYASGSAEMSVVVLGAESQPRDDIRLVVAPRSRILGTDKAYYLLFALRHLVAGRFDRVFILGINFAMLAPVARLVGPKGCRVVVRSGSIDHLLKKWGRVMSSVLILSERQSRHAHAVVAVTASIQGHLANLGIQSIIIRNGLERAAPVDPKRLARRARSVLAVGRLTVQKNYAVLIEAMALMGADAPPLTIVGGADSTPEAGRIEALARERDARSVTFAGAKPRSDVIASMAAAGLFVNCSHHEGMSNAVLEAIQEGMPLIVSDIDANRDLDLPEHHYFRPDDPAALAVLIAQALAEPARFVVSPALFDDWRTAIARFCEVLEIPAPPLRAPSARRLDDAEPAAPLALELGRIK